MPTKALSLPANLSGAAPSQLTSSTGAVELALCHAGKRGIMAQAGKTLFSPELRNDVHSA